MTLSPTLVAGCHRLVRFGLATAAIGAALCAFGYFRFREQFYPAYLTAFLYWLSLSLGCLAVAMIHGLTGGAWGRMVRRIIEAGYQTLPVMALLFVPLWLDASSIYEWADPEFVSRHESLIRKSGYLTISGYHWRAIAYFVCWCLITWSLDRASPNQEREADSPRSRRLQRISGQGMMAYGFTLTFAAVDWVMSLEPEWYSTMYGLIQIAGQGMAGLAFGLAVAVSLRDFEPWSRIVTPVRLIDFGNLMLASVMFWAYCSYFQFLVIWSGNLPEENSWYVRRSRDGWQYLAICLFLFHFAVPFLLLLSRKLKRNPESLAAIAKLLLVMHYVDLYWIVVPGFQRAGATQSGITFHWLSVVTWLTMGGLWLAVFIWRLSIRVQLPIYDPEFVEREQ